MTRLALFAAFVATVVGANLALNEWGMVHLLGGGLMVPAGVYAAGLAFTIRDALHELGGRHARRWVLTAIAVGGVVSYLIEGDQKLDGGRVPVAVASAVAFSVSELADFAVYERVRRRSRGAAVLVSNTVGAAIDSALFLSLAFGSFAHTYDLTLGKFLMTAPAAALLPWVWTRAVPRHRLDPAGA